MPSDRLSSDTASESKLSAASAISTEASAASSAEAGEESPLGPSQAQAGEDQTFSELARLLDIELPQTEPQPEAAEARLGAEVRPDDEPQSESVAKSAASNSKTAPRAASVATLGISTLTATMLLLMLVVVGLLAALEISRISTVKALTAEIASASLPELVESQNVLLDIENLRRLTEVAYVTGDRRIRSDARLGAMTLVAESLDRFSKLGLTKGDEAARAIGGLATTRDRMATLADEMAAIELNFFQALQALADLHDDVGRRHLLYLVFMETFPTNVPYDYGRSGLDERREVEAAVREGLDELADFVVELKAQGLPPAMVDRRAATLEEIVRVSLSKKSAWDALTQELSRQWRETDLILRSLRDQVRLDSQRAVGLALESIEASADSAASATKALFALIAAAFAFFFSVFFRLVISPLRWTFGKLADIQAGRLDDGHGARPPITVKEIAGMAELLDRFSGQLTEIYAQANQFEEEAARSKDLEAVMKAVFAASIDGYLVWNGLRAVKSSPQILKMLGLDDEDQFTRDVARLGLSPEHLDEVFDAASFAGSVQEELLLSDAAGAPVPCELAHLPIVYGGRQCLLTCVRDLRAQKLSEAALRAAKDQADAAAKAKSEFLANMSHEIRTPMNGILGLTHLLMETSLNENQADFLSRIRQSAGNLLRIINDILDFSKIEAGRLEIEMTEFRLEALLKSVIDSASTQADQKGVELIMHVPPRPCGVLVGDPVRLGQVLHNLVGNAIKFTEEGYVAVSVVERERRRSDQTVLQFEVRDTGIGIAPGQTERLFAAFSQADASTTRKYGGTGLGLAISKRLVEMMDGELWCESEPGQGSRFVFTARFRLGPAAEEAPAPELKRRNASALVVAAVEPALDNLCEHLRHFALRPDGRLDPEQALAELAADPGKYDILLVAQRIRTSTDFVERVRKIVDKERLPAVLMHSASAQLNQEAELAFFNAFLLTPFSSSSLFNALSDAFGEKVSRAKAAAGVLTAEAAQLSGRFKGRRILLAEDNEVNQLVAKKILEKAGLNVTIANNGQEAVDLLSASAYDLVFMDIQMPVMDGLAAARTLRADPKHVRLPIIAMTAHAMLGDRELSLEAGMNDHITKPINLKELYGALSRWLEPQP
ncbi:MAG: response regulator [Deltaproteobacteria bacterium]|nr:response regulator [Deltaproteobacteria bacterium]